jgi:hypothetical protein
MPFLDCPTDGVMIRDDSSRECYQPGLSEIQAPRFRALCIARLKPEDLRTDETPFIYRVGKCLVLK